MARVIGVVDIYRTKAEWRAARRKVFECSTYRMFETAVHARMKVLGLSRRQLAERMNMDPGNLTRLLKHQHNPTFETLERVAQALDCDLLVTLAPMRGAR